MTSRRHLTLVDDDYIGLPRAYVLWLGDEDDDFDEAIVALTRTYNVVNESAESPVDEIDMRVHLRCLADADVLVLQEHWWTSATAYQLVTIAGWSQIQLITPEGAKIATVSAKVR